MHTLTALVPDAEIRFGKVEIARFRPIRGDYAFLIKRNDPAIPELPFMTITGYRSLDSGDAVFVHGHYDLKEKDALDDFNLRVAQ